MGRARIPRAMPKVQANRTLVKSPPELWAELSDIESLAGHLGELGEIRITRTDPETTVAWEGENARGTVEIEASGWGTKVTLTAELEEPEPEPEPEPQPEPEPEPEPEPVPEPEAVTIEHRVVEPEPPVEAAPRTGFFARWFGRKQPVVVVPEPEPERSEPEPPTPDAGRPTPDPTEPEPPTPDARRPTPPEPPPNADADADETLAVLEATLDALGSAHHRPFSRG
jgi:hypothetical protein